MRRIVIGAFWAALMTPAPVMAQQAQQNAAIECGKELQECSLYYLLLAGDLLLQVPQNSGPLSPADQDKAVKAMVIKTKSEQIDVIVNRLASLTGTADEFKARASSMFEQQKRIMGCEWNMSRLHDRYKAFCEYVLSNTGGKARLKDLELGNVCGGLYKCWR
jgi:hypothetical protein